MASRVVIRVNLERAEDIVHLGVAVVSRARVEDTQAHGAAANQERADLDQERAESLEDGIQVHLVAVIAINLAMVEDIQMEEDTIVDTMDMEVILVAQVVVGLLAANLARAAEAHLGHLAVNQARVVAVQAGLAVGRVARAVVTHLLLTQAHGIHQEVVTLNLPTPNLPTVVVLKMMGTGTLVVHRLAHGHLLVASRVRAEEVAHQVAAGAHPLRVNLASLDTEEI